MLLLLCPDSHRPPHVQESNDMRKRARQERLNELRTGTKLSWVQLNRMLPAVDGT